MRGFEPESIDDDDNTQDGSLDDRAAFDAWLEAQEQNDARPVETLADAALKDVPF